MDRMFCDGCGVEHDLSEMEPAYRWPDAYLDVPEDERESRTRGGRSAVGVREAEDAPWRRFIRVLLPFRVHGESEPYSWGIWVEISEDAWRRTYARWDDPAQADEPPFAARVANRLNGYEGTLDLAGHVRLVSPRSVPTFHLDDGVDHPLAREQQAGIGPERVVEWVSWHH